MSDLTRIGDELRAQGLSPLVDAPFGRHTTWAVGGRAALMVEVSGADEIRAVARVTATAPGTEVFVLGNGSNTLVSDTGFQGLVVRLRPPQDPDAGAVTVLNGQVEVPGWMPLPVLARRSVAAGACGLEWAVGVPGTVGGAVRMNAGGHGAETADALVAAEVVSLRSGRSMWVGPNDLGLHFRGSALAPWHVVTAARLSVSDPVGHDCAAELTSIVAWRREHQPGGRNAGSVFVNPAPGEGSSGALIDKCGLRGFSVGGASVSDKHANFVQATADTTSDDIITLMTEVRDRVAQSTGIRLTSEVRLVGFAADVLRELAVRDVPDQRRVALCTLLGETP